MNLGKLAYYGCKSILIKISPYSSLARLATSEGLAIARCRERAEMIYIAAHGKMESTTQIPFFTSTRKTLWA